MRGRIAWVGHCPVAYQPHFLIFPKIAFFLVIRIGSIIKLKGS